MKVTVTSPVVKRCPYKAETDHGTIEVTFAPPQGTDAPEIHNLAVFIRTFEESEVSHEDFTRALLLGTGAERVVTRWRTAGLDVTCDLSRESDR